MITATQAQADALYGVGHWLLEQQRYEDAKHLFRTMLLAAPTDERGWLGLGACHENTGEDEKAAHLYALAGQACADSVRSALALCRVLRKLDRDGEADEAYARAVELAETSGDADLAALVASEGGMS